jgi:glycosyltransferase involved in cell wall biosynthesis
MARGHPAVARTVDSSRRADYAFTDTYLPRRDGVVTSVLTLVAALSAAGHPATTVVPRHPGQPDRDGLLRLRAVPCGVADLRMSPWLLRGSWAIGALAAIAAAAPDVVHVHTPGPIGLLGVLAARRLGVPLVQTYHTDLHAYADAYRLPSAALRAGLRLYAHRLGMPRPAQTPAQATGPGRRGAASGRRRATLDATYALLLGEAAAVVVPSRAVFGRFDPPVAADRVFVIPTGVADRPVNPAAVLAFRSFHRIGATDRVILFVGRVNREKGVDLLISAFARLAGTVPDVRLVLVGAVYDSRWLAGLLQDAGIADRVVVAGQQNPEVVRAAYGIAEVLAFPSITDTQGLVLQEAAHAGVPIVMADPALHAHGPLGGAAVLTGGRPAEFAAGIRGLLDEPTSARRLAARAARRAAELSPEGYAAAMTDVYQWCAATVPSGQ